MAKWLALALLAVMPVTAFTQEAPTFEEGVNYHWVASNPAQGDSIQVLEFFWYSCPHCYSFEPYLEKWLETKPADVEVVKVPATFNRPEVMMHARTFYALEAMGVPPSIHVDIMAEMHDRKNKMSDQAAVERFLESKGVDIAAFRQAMESFAVYVKVQQAQQMAQRFSISGVPALVVDGQYRSGDVKSYDHMIGLLDFLIEEARQSRGAQ
jgi:thiol:disulfide interchange protein DsbA